MRSNRKIRTENGVAVLLAGCVLSVLILFYSWTQSSSSLQTAFLLASMLLMFFSSHALGHYLVARSSGVTVDYFFLGRSDFRRLQMRPMKAIGDVPTIGTKLNAQRLSSLSPRRKGYIFGAGAILSCVLVGIELAYAASGGFHLLATAVGSAFLVAAVASELLFGTKVGDLAKMKRQFRLEESEGP